MVLRAIGVRDGRQDGGKSGGGVAVREAELFIGGRVSFGKDGKSDGYDGAVIGTTA